MNSNIIRTQRSQVGVIAFTIAALVFVAQLGNSSNSVRVICSVFGAFCLVGVVRSSRSGFIEMDTETIKVRTLYRCRTFALKDIDRVEARSFLQVTSRVMPVLIFRDGREYRLSEFFVQHKTFRDSPDENLVTRVVDVIGEWLTTR